MITATPTSQPFPIPSTLASSIIDLAKKFEDAGVAVIIYTDINRDGTGQGADFVGTKKLAESVSIPVIASGGIGGIDDVREIAQLNIDGVIIGRALYDGKIDVGVVNILLSGQLLS